MENEPFITSILPSVKISPWPLIVQVRLLINDENPVDKIRIVPQPEIIVSNSFKSSKLFISINPDFNFTLLMSV